MRLECQNRYNFFHHSSSFHIRLEYFLRNSLVYLRKAFKYWIVEFECNWILGRRWCFVVLNTGHRTLCGTVLSHLGVFAAPDVALMWKLGISKNEKMISRWSKTPRRLCTILFAIVSMNREKWIFCENMMKHREIRDGIEDFPY